MIRSGRPRSCARSSRSTESQLSTRKPPSRCVTENDCFVPFVDHQLSNQKVLNRIADLLRGIEQMLVIKMGIAGS